MFSAYPGPYAGIFKHACWMYVSMPVCRLHGRPLLPPVAGHVVIVLPAHRW